MKHFFMAILFSVLTLTGPAHSQAVDDASRTYADQFAKESVIVHALLIDGEPAQQEAIQTVLANPERFTPMVLYPFSRALFVSGRFGFIPRKFALDLMLVARQTVPLVSLS